MNITPITKENIEFFQRFITDEDERFIRDDLMILPLGLVADDLEKDRNSAAGALCIRPDDFMLNITSFYVSPEYRGRGAGRFLLDEAKRIFGEQDMEFDIEFLLYGKEEENLAEFLEGYGFSYADPEYDVYELTVADLKKTRLAGKTGEGEPFSSIPKTVFNMSQNEAKDRDALLPLGGIKSERIDEDISVGIVNEYVMDCFVIFEKISEKKLLLSSLYAQNNAPTTLLHMLEISARMISEKYPDDTIIIIQPVDETGLRLVNKIYEDARIISCRYRYII